MKFSATISSSPRFSVLTYFTAPSSNCALTTSSPIRNVPPAAINDSLSCLWERIPATDGGNVPRKMVFALIFLRTSSTEAYDLSPKTAGRTTRSSSWTTALTAATNFALTDSFSITLEILDERISLGFLRRVLISSVVTAVILHETPLFSNSAAISEVLKSKKPSTFTINALVPIFSSFSLRNVESPIASHAGFSVPVADIT